jgi:hypothetical protein
MLSEHHVIQSEKNHAPVLHNGKKCYLHKVGLHRMTSLYWLVNMIC